MNKFFYINYVQPLEIEPFQRKYNNCIQNIFYIDIKYADIFLTYFTASKNTKESLDNFIIYRNITNSVELHYSIKYLFNQLPSNESLWYYSHIKLIQDSVQDNEIFKYSFITSYSMNTVFPKFVTKSNMIYEVLRDHTAPITMYDGDISHFQARDLVNIIEDTNYYNSIKEWGIPME